MMESLEVWHAEEVEATLTGRSAAELASRLPYDVMTLGLAPMSLLTAHVLLDWLPAETLPGREPTFVPHGVVSLDLRVHDGWSLPLFAPLSDGLASGNTASEAELHGLLEVVEREAVARWRARGWVAPLPQASADAIGERSSAVLRMLEAAGLSWRVWDCTGPAELPCYLVTVSSEFFLRQTAGGSGCHPDPDLALRTAILEAVQARVAAIAGSRDDLRLRTLEWRTPPDGRPGRPGPAAAVASDGPVPPVADEAGMRDRVRDVAERIRREAGHDPIVADLTSPMGIPVVKVVAPGLRRQA
jgi:ribosomal protein S12 methylthiotransferase accessory factor